MIESVDHTTEVDKVDRKKGINYNHTRLRGMVMIRTERDKMTTDSICVAHAHASKEPPSWSTPKDYENILRAFFLGDKSNLVNSWRGTIHVKFNA